MRGTREERDILDSAIIDSSHQQRGTVVNSTGNYNTTSQTSVPEPQEVLDEESPSEDSQTEIWRYTRTLQDRFAGSGVAPIYHESTIRGYPPNFRAEVTYRGQRFSGEAGNKKLAKHRASKKLCESLDISLPGQ